MVDNKLEGFVKSADEIEKIRESCQIVADTLKLVEKNISIGITTKELDDIAEDFILSCGGEPAFKGVDIGNGSPFGSTLCVSINEEVVHGIPSNRKLENGDIVSVDVGVVKNSYFGDAARTFAVGEVSEEKRKLMDVTHESLMLGIEQAIPGNRLFDISKAIQTNVEKNGFSVVRDLVGHGVGRDLWEYPQIPNFVPKPLLMNKKNNPILVEGVTFAIEPMVNYGTYNVKVREDKWTVYAADMQPSAHYEHTILITKDKPEILTL